jgi:hypothetical protein
MSNVLIPYNKMSETFFFSNYLFFFFTCQSKLKNNTYTHTSHLTLFFFPIKRIIHEGFSNMFLYIKKLLSVNQKVYEYKYSNKKENYVY